MQIFSFLERGSKRSVCSHQWAVFALLTRTWETEQSLFSVPGNSHISFELWEIFFHPQRCYSS